MLERIARGELPVKPHTVFRSADGGDLRYEECLTRQGFDGPFSILYHRHRPHEAESVEAQHGFRVPPRVPPTALAGADRPSLRRRHYRCLDLPTPVVAPIDGRVPLLYNSDVVIGFVQPSVSDPVYFVNADADDLFFIFRGGGTLQSVFGDLPFKSGDYLCVPKGTPHRFLVETAQQGAAEGGQAWLSVECRGGLDLPRHYRNDTGQLRMDAPYSHRDFRRPELAPAAAPEIRDTVVKRDDTFFGFRSRHDPLDVVGWDGAVYPFALPILSFAPRVGQIHLPPPVHATFQAGGALICSFVPRPLDFHPAANPCPYPHASVDVDEVLFYANGAFGSRRGVGPGSISHHPAGIPHGPHPGAYENAPGTTHTEELAVMLDCFGHLSNTAESRTIEDTAYHGSFAAD
jgi:homogentisate 1,2-dioxygenase